MKTFARLNRTLLLSADTVLSVSFSLVTWLTLNQLFCYNFTLTSNSFKSLLF